MTNENSTSPRTNHTIKRTLVVAAAALLIVYTTTVFARRSGRVNGYETIPAFEAKQMDAQWIERLAQSKGVANPGAELEI